MIPFGRLLSFPLTFKNLEPKIKDLKIDNIEAIESQGTIEITSLINGHQSEILIDGNLIESNVPTRVYCDCEFFTYNLAYGLYKTQSLLHPERFILRPPKKKNVFLTLSGCKHLILLAQSIYQNRNLIKKNS